jgi:hypothetical protein
MIVGSNEPCLLKRVEFAGGYICALPLFIEVCSDKLVQSLGFSPSLWLLSKSLDFDI